MMIARRAIPVVLGVMFWAALLAVGWGHPGHAAPDQVTSKPSLAQQDSASEAATGGKHSRSQVLVASLTVFVLAVFIGFEVIGKVPPTLHTPLMSGSNAISGITVVGAMLAAGHPSSNALTSWLGFVAIVLANINVVGGFLVTHRMLAMFKGPKGK